MQEANWKLIVWGICVPFYFLQEARHRSIFFVSVKFLSDVIRLSVLPGKMNENQPKQRLPKKNVNTIEMFDNRIYSLCDVPWALVSYNTIRMGQSNLNFLLLNNNFWWFSDIKLIFMYVCMPAFICIENICQ